MIVSLVRYLWGFKDSIPGGVLTTACFSSKNIICCIFSFWLQMQDTDTENRKGSGTHRSKCKKVKNSCVIQLLTITVSIGGHISSFLSVFVLPLYGDYECGTFGWLSAHLWHQYHSTLSMQRPMFSSYIKLKYMIMKLDSMHPILIWIKFFPYCWQFDNTVMNL